ITAPSNMLTTTETSLRYYSISTWSELQEHDPTTSEHKCHDWQHHSCHHHSHAPIILTCITVYNESGSALLYSLAGIKHNLDYLVTIGNRSLAERITLCIIIDGKEKMSPSAATLLETLVLYDPNQAKSGADMHVFDSHLNIDLLEDLVCLDSLHQKSDNPWLDVYQAAMNDHVPILPPLDRSVAPRVLLCIKDANAGKLNSHWWFFKVFCTHLQPDYCIQMDAGSVPKAPNIHDLWQFLEQHPDVGAATGSILVPAPQKPWHLISLWQYGNFCLDKLLFRPAEALFGYLSVLPGQFSILRWETLKTDLNKSGAQIQQTSPLDRYFRGTSLDQLDIFEANMFLTEDRILCSEIAMGQSSSWRLAYLPSVESVTDSCQSLPELLRQRRRWINGSLACRLWLFAQLPTYLLRRNIGIDRKLALLTSTPLYVIRSLNDWFNLSLTILITTFIYLGERYLMFSHDLSGWPTSAAFIGELSLLTCQILLYHFGKQSNLLAFANIIYGGLYVGAALILSTCLGYYPPLIIVMSLMLGINGIALVHSPQFARKNWLYLPLYFLVTIISLLLNAYAFFNVHDYSWGTKGLTDKAFQTQYRHYYISLWLLSNFALVVAALSFHWYILVMVLAFLDLAIGLVAGFSLACSSLINQWFRFEPKLTSKVKISLDSIELGVG
ncbi:MAG: hypothetical protein NW214_05425, partial [Pseudanabaenaceae cyanobacterium bins.39]|nr:hypothetical protein [Pseudanabaenaceae cyanobacterium bins.39]